MLKDGHNRIISYLRISVTDRCNFRCVYCMPEGGVELAPKASLLSFEEIAHVARVGASLGLHKIRITGGEPTVRRDLPTLIGMLRAIPGIGEIAMTTNAARLGELAAPLKAAGLTRVNISLDTLDPQKAQQIARRDSFEEVMHGIAAAAEAGLGPLKFNTVVMRGTNDDELGDLARFAHSYDAQIRFNSHNAFMSAAEMRERLAAQFDLVPEVARGACGESNDPARGWVCRRTGARLGFITSMSEHFCDTCNRMRLTAEGGLRPCLHQDAEVDIRRVLREGGTNADLAAAFQAAANLKWAGHHMTDFIPLYSAKEMVAIGG